MIESIIARVLNQYVGKYIQNLDSSNLNVSILQGDVELTDLQLRPEALVELDLPIEVKAGYVGHLKIDIPWSNLFTADIHVSLEDVYVLAGPVTDRQYDPQRERLLANASKRQKLAALQSSAIADVAAKSEEDSTFYEKLTTNLVNRLQVSVRNIHIRYEDTVTNVDHPFACGIMLKQILVLTTNSKWEAVPQPKSSSLIHKLMRLEDLSVYWNPYIPEQHLIRSRLNTDGWRNLLRMSIDSHSIFEEDFDFIIEPATAQAQLILSSDGNFSLPKVFANFTLEEIEILLSRQQFLNLLSLSESFEMMRVNQRYRKYHPNVPLKVSPRSWWRYAYTAVLEEFIRPFSWERIKEHRALYRKYKNLYKKSLEQRDHESTQSKLAEMEEQLDIANILIAREQAKLEFSMEAPERAKRKKKEQSWWSSWFGGGEEEEVEVEILDKDKDWIVRLSEEEKEKLYKGIGYDENTKAMVYPKQYVAYKVQFVLKSCCVSLVNYSKKILQMSVTHLLATLEHRPGAGAFRLSSNTESFSIEGASIEHELIPILTSDIGVYAPAVNQVFTLDFETKPLYVDADYSLNLNVQPVEIVYDEHSISEVTAFFQVPHGGVDMKLAAMATLEEVAKYSRAGLQYAIEQHKSLHVAVNMRSPYIVVPEFGTLHRGGNVLIADFGTLRIESELQPKDVSLEDATMSEIESRLYDQFNITVSEVKVLLADSGDDWHTAQTQPDSEYHILPSVQIVVAFFNAVKRDYKQLPQQKLIASVPTLKLNISDKRMLLLMSFLRNFPVPASTSMATLGEDAVDGAPPPPPPPIPLDLMETQQEPDLGSLRKMRRSILGRRVVDKSPPIITIDKAPMSRKDSGDGEDSYYSASDHSDEDVDEWSEFVSIKAVDDNSSLSNSIRVLARLTLGEFVINLAKVMDRHEQPYLMFRVDRLQVDAALTVHGYALQATLGGLQLVDKIHVGSSGEYMEILNTQSNTDLVSITYRKVDQECPDFGSLYNNTEHAVVLKFHAMSALFDQASMIYLSTFITGLITSVQSMDMKTSTSSVISTADSGNKDRPSLVKRLTSITDQVDAQPPHVSKVNLVAEVQDIRVTLCDSDSSLAEVCIRGLEAHVLAKSSRNMVRCRLKDLSLIDRSVGAAFPKVLMIENDSLFDLKFVQFNKTGEGSRGDNKRRQGLDYSLRIRVGGLQGVLLGKFYWEVTRFFEPFINPEMTEAAKAAARETVQKKVEDIQSQNLRVSLHVQLRTPTLLLPPHSSSTEMFVLRLGDLALSNVFDFTAASPDARQEWNHLYLSLNSIRIERGVLSLADDSLEILHHVMEPLSFKADMRLAMKPIVSDVKYDISGELDKVNLHLFQKDLQLLQATLAQNFSEGAPQPTSGIYESPTVQNLNLPPESGLGALTPVEEETESLTDGASPTSPSAQKLSTTVLLRFAGVSAMLYQEQSTTSKQDPPSLCLLSLDKLNLSCTQHSDGDLKVNFALQTVAIDDTRPSSNLACKRILFFAEKQDASDKLPLMSLIYKVSSDGNQKADLMVEKLRLNLSVPFVMSLLEFLRPVVSGPEDVVDASVSMTTSTVQPPPAPAAAAVATFSVYGSFKQPEVVLLADPTNVDSRAIILYSSIAFEYRNEGEKQVFWSKVSDLKMVSTMVGSSHQTCGTVLAPCAVELRQTHEGGVMDVTVSLTKVDIFLSATVIHTLQSVASMIKLPEPKPEPSSSKSKNSESKNLWKVSKVTAERWLRPDVADQAVSLQTQLASGDAKQRLTLDIDEVSAMFEVENLDYHIPILCLRTSLHAKLSDWSSLVKLDLELEVDVLFYNESLSTWEPLVEPVQEKEGVYRPWGVYIKMGQGQSFPITCNYDERELDVPDGLQSEVQQLMHKARARSSSSETDTDSSTDMTVIRQRSQRKIRHSSDHSYESNRGTRDSLSHHSSMQGESDSEPEGFINNITNKLGSIFSSDSSDADVSETDDNDDIFDPSLDKPVFITSRGPVGVSAGVIGMDEVDGGAEEEDSNEKCLYIVVDSSDVLRLNVTPKAMKVVQDVAEAMANPASDLCSVRNLPAFEINNKLGIHTYLTLHPSIKIHKDGLHQCTVFRAGEDKENIRPYANDTDDEGIENLDEESKHTSLDESDGLGVVRRTLANAAHMLTNAGAFVFDDDDDYLSGEKLDRHRLRLQVEGFEPLPSILHQRACHRLLPLTPKRELEDNQPELQNGTKYCIVMDVDMLHGRKVISIHAPLQLENQLTMAVDVWCRTEELKRHATTAGLARGGGELSRLTTLAPQASFCLPLMVAFHCSLFIGPADINYEPAAQGVWWQDLLQSKERCKVFMSQSLQEEKKAFYFKVLCREGEKLHPPQAVPRTIPYYVLSLHPPVTIHNYLPYDIQFSLQGTSASTSLTHGDSTPLYTVDLQKSHRLLLGISDYLGCDWSGSLEIAPGMDVFKAIAMETDIDLENVNKHLSLSIHANQSQSLDLFIYSPYWIINKTELQLQLRGSMSDTLFECGPATNPLLFRFKKHKRKKAKLRIYESKWSQSFSLDTVGSSGVVVCNDRERNRKFMFMVQSQLSKLKLTKIITILPLFLVINRCSQKLRYMEENEDADLWFDIAPGECQPFWPATESYCLFVRYDNSSVVSQHFPLRTPHSTVLRMDRGTALCVEVAGGTNTPTTITFTDYEDGNAPARIINLCEDVFIKIHQKNQSQVSLLSSGQMLLYTWDEPVAERTLMWNVYGRKKPSFAAFISKDGSDSVQLRVQSLTSAGVMDVTDAADAPGSSPEDDSDEVDALLGVGGSMTLLGRTRTDKMVIFWVSFLDGFQRTLLFTQDERIANSVKRMNEGEQMKMSCFFSLEGVMVSVINEAYEEVALLTVGSSPAIWEVEVNGRWKLLNVELATWLEDQWRNHKPFASLQDQIEADLIKMQMSKPFIGSLRRTQSPGFWAQYRTSLHHTSLHARVQRLQIDNQLCDAYFPSVLYPAPIPSYILRRTSRKPFLELGLMRRTVKESNCDTFRYFKLLIQKFNLHLDRGFALSLYDVFSNMQKEEAESHQLHADLLVAQKSLQELAAVMVALRPQKIYFEYLHLSPLKMSVSTSVNGTVHTSSVQPASITGDIVNFFLTSIGVTFTEMKDVEFKMAYFERKGVVVSRDQLLQQVVAHYKQQVLLQIYVLILGIDVLGNPYGLVRDFTQGLGDFFYEPFLGSIQGSDEFAVGLSRGVESLLGNTVGGTAGSFASITGSIGSALAALSFDEEYRRQRRTRMSQQPRHLPASLAEAAKNLLMGVCLGFSGVILDPIKGAHEDGVEGFFRGVGKGIMGLLTKPAGGVADMVSMAFDGVRRAAEMETGVVARARLPRFINPYMGLRPYSEWKATGMRLLQSVQKGEFARTDIYWAHAPLSQGERSDILLITDRHLMILERQRFWGQWDVDWISIDSILGVPAIVENKLVFKIKQDESASLNLFASSEREVTCGLADVLEWLQKQVENVIKYRQQ